MTRRRLIALVLLAVAATFALYLQRDPIELSMQQSERAGAPPLPRADASVWLAVSHSQIDAAAAASRFSESDWSYAWLGALREELGAIGVVNVDTLTMTAPWPPPEVHLLVWTSSASVWDGADPAATVQRLADWVRAGGRIVLDAADGALAEHLGVALLAPQPATTVTQAVGAPSYVVDDWLEGLPGPTQRRRARALPESARPFLWIDGDAASWSWPSGLGNVTALGFDLGAWLTVLRQGRPRDDFSVHRTRGTDGREQFLQPNDFMADPDRAMAWIPRSDVLLRTTLNAARGARPLARLSPLPAGARGLFVMTHDEENFGDRSTFMSDEVALQGVHSTFFVMPDNITIAGTQSMLDAGCDVQLHWNRGFWTRQTTRIGIGPFRPFLREQNLVDQLNELRDRLPPQAPPLESNRNHGLLWDEHYTRTFRILQASGIQLDSTYGPDQDLFGWVFDTARPFHPVDTNGYPFELLESAFPYQDDENYDPQWQKRLLYESARGYRNVMMPIYHTVTMQWNPDAFRMRGWLNSFEEAPQFGHPIWSVSQYLTFRRQRMESTLSARILTLPSGRGPNMIIDVEAIGDEQALELPALAGRSRVLISVDGGSPQILTAESWDWFQLPLTAGSHRIQASYRGEGE